MHTVPALDHWPPVPLAPREPVRRRSSISLLIEFAASGKRRRAIGRGATVSDAIFEARASIPETGEWRVTRFFPVDPVRSV
jgi:hypothetical protein